MKTGISEESFKSAARELQCEIELIKAVDAKESRGFLKNGDVKILLNLISLEIFKVCRNKTYSFKYLLSSLGTSLQKKASSTQSFKKRF
jgi:hypothetical protein